jgi:hypothetical protein
MPKIVDPNLLNVGVEISLDPVAKTFTLNEAGNMIAKDGVSGKALWLKFNQLWATATYQPYDFPMNKIDNRSGQYVFGKDPNGKFTGWAPANDATRNMIRDAGWEEYDGAGVLTRVYVGVVVGSNAPAGTQFFYQKASGGPAIDFVFTDSPNQAVQVYGNATNGNFDTRSYFKVFLRRYNYTFDSKVLGDIFETGTGPYKISFGMSTAAETKVSANDATVAANVPYTNVSITYFGSNQNKTIGSGSYPFRVVIDNTTANATLEQIYTKIQYQLRQNADIDAGAGTVTGKTADSLCYFVGDTLYTTLGVFIEGVLPADLNRVVFLDQNGVSRQYPFASAGNINVNAILQQGGTGYYRMYFKTLPGGSNDYGEGGAITVKDKDGVDITGVITGASIGFTFDYDGNVQGGRTAAQDAEVVVVAGNAGVSKPAVAEGLITKSKGITITLNAEQDLA